MLFKQQKAKKDSGFLIGLYAILLILSPIINLGIGAPIRLDDFFLIFLLLRIPADNIFIPDYLKVVLSFFFLSCFLSLLIGIAGGNLFSITSANDVLVVLRMIIIASVVKYYVRSTKDINYLFNCLTFAISISAIVAILQYARIQPFAAFLTKIYSQNSAKYLDALRYNITNWRVVSTYGNPNYAGLFFCFGAVLCMHRSAQHNGMRIVYDIFYIAFIAVCILAVSSRTSLLIIILCSLFYLFLFLFINRRRISQNIVMVLKMVCLVGLMILIFNVTAERFIPERIKNFLIVSRNAEQLHNLELGSRGGNWEKAFSDLSKHGRWLFGNGPGIKTSIDSEYLYILFTQGIIGLVLVMILWFKPFVSFFRLKIPEHRNIALCLLTVILAFPIFGINAPVLFNAKVGPTVILFLGTWQVLQKTEKLHRGVSFNILKKQI